MLTNASTLQWWCIPCGLRELGGRRDGSQGVTMGNRGVVLGRGLWCCRGERKGVGVGVRVRVTAEVRGTEAGVGHLWEETIEETFGERGSVEQLLSLDSHLLGAGGGGPGFVGQFGEI
jgi:hypothetical protein